MVVHMVKNLPTLWETWAQSLDQEDSPGEGNGCPLQHSGLENPMDGRTWWAIVHGVVKESDMTEQPTLSHLCLAHRKNAINISYYYYCTYIGSVYA